MRGTQGLRWAAAVAVAVAVLPATPAGAIEGGWDADAAHYPYQVAVEYRGSHICAGSVLGPTSVLAPAHCADVMSLAALTVRAGTLLRAADPGEPRGTRQRVTGVTVHPGYDPSTRAADLAVLTLAAPLPLGADLKAVTLPPQDSDPAPGTTATVSGWGAATAQTTRSPRLRAARTTVVPRTACAGSPTDLTAICAAPDGARLRRGDDGNPLIADSTLLGIAAVPDRPDGDRGDRFVNIGSYSTWIRGTARLR